MTRDELQAIPINKLRTLASQKGHKITIRFKKEELINLLLGAKADSPDARAADVSPIPEQAEQKAEEKRIQTPKEPPAPAQAAAETARPAPVRRPRAMPAPQAGEPAAQDARTETEPAHKPVTTFSRPLYTRRPVADAAAPGKEERAADDAGGSTAKDEFELPAGADASTTPKAEVMQMLRSDGTLDKEGMLELMPDGYGFLRTQGYQSHIDDVYISAAQIRRFSLRAGDMVRGKTRFIREGDRHPAMLYITHVNDFPPGDAIRRKLFEDLEPVYPNERLTLENLSVSRDIAVRLIDLLAPIGKGQRGLIVSPPKAGKTILLSHIANCIAANYPEVKLIMLLIDERPEEVTEIKRTIRGEVAYSTFDEQPENHTRIAEMVLGRAQRLVEHGQDVVILLDSITRLARAYNMTITPTGRLLTGGLDPGALYKPKRFFGSARNIERGGSLTIIATALLETGSRMDEIIFEEFKGTGNMEIKLDRRLSEKRVFPAVDIAKSGTRREELLLSSKELEGNWAIRKAFSFGNATDVTEQLISMMLKTNTNDEFVDKLKVWLSIYEKEGYGNSFSGR